MVQGWLVIRLDFHGFDHLGLVVDGLLASLVQLSGCGWHFGQ